MEHVDLVSLQQKVTSLRAEGKYKETIEGCQELLALGTEANDPKSMLVAHLNKMSSYYCIGDIEEAFKSLSEYKEVCSQYGDDTDYLNLYNCLCLLHEFNKDYVRAKATLDKSIELGKRLKKYNIISNGYSNYSHLYMAEGNYADALYMAKEGLLNANLHEPPNEMMKLRVKLNLAKAHIGLGHFAESKILIDEMMSNSVLESFVREKANLYDLQGFWHTKQGQYREAFDWYTRAKELVESYDDVYLLKAIQEERCKLCELMNDVQLGYSVQKEYIALLNVIMKRELALVALKLDIKHSIADIEKNANTDYLTGLFNRKYMEETTDQWLKAARENEETIICIVFDIDNFKTINDTYGHLFGDEAIQQVGRAISRIFSRDDLVGRYGGDEFVIVLRNVSLEDGILRAEQIKESFYQYPIIKDDLSVSITASIGVADNTDTGIETFKDLFHLADVRLYMAKQNGKNQIEV
ncbi:GGDEF domain-containing protein [Gorillibacterium massiliense]|uniref:GGDEF domain-containing protein n=1 Tax=Gorillibacterium massiliense TaxID=1280390 RepID=UPI0004AD499A|nr:GGDEF domain-containing protein [Gorillibacterium massiliense]